MTTNGHLLRKEYCLYCGREPQYPYYIFPRLTSKRLTFCNLTHAEKYYKRESMEPFQYDEMDPARR